jgi:hypothetical protein
VNEKQRRAQLTAAEGRLVRTEWQGTYFVAVLECGSVDALKRTKSKLKGQGWSHVRTSGLSVMIKVEVG